MESKSVQDSRAPVSELLADNNSVQNAKLKLKVNKLLNLALST